MPATHHSIFYKPDMLPTTTHIKALKAIISATENLFKSNMSYNCAAQDHHCCRWDNKFN